MDVKTFADGIAFYNDKIEVAFYSNITERISYNSGAYPVWHDIGCASIPVEDSLFINDTVKKYLEKKKKSKFAILTEVEFK